MIETYLELLIAINKIRNITVYGCLGESLKDDVNFSTHRKDFTLKKYLGGYVLYRRLEQETLVSINHPTKDPNKILKIIKDINKCEEK